jgi:hypothetical protein
VAGAAPDSRIILDANEGWTSRQHPPSHAGRGPLPGRAGRAAAAGRQDAILARIPIPFPVCADESVHGTDDLDMLVGLYDAVNIKLDKTGGLTEAIRLHRRARELGFGIMVGCMVGTSLAMAPAVLLAQDAEFVDLDGPLLLQKDREPCLSYDRLDGFTARARTVGLRSGGARCCRPARAVDLAFGLLAHVGPGNDREGAVEILHHGRAAFHPVARIDVADAVHVLDRGMVDVAADDAFGVGLARLVGHHLLEGADEGDRLLHLDLGP